MSQNELLPCGCGELEYVHIKVVAHIRKGIVGVVECQRCGEVVSFVSIGTAFQDEFTDDAYMAWNRRIEAAQAVAPGGGMCAKGQAFKDYVHQRLDAMGVPHSVPESEHDKAGCRIGGRLDFVEARIAPGGGDESTQPHPRWKVGRGDRHPQTADEWNWREDGPENGGGLARSVKRLNVAMDYDDPRAPDQMALVLRVDLMRVQQALVWRTAQSDSFRERLAAASASEAKGPCCEHAGTFLCSCGKFTLIEKPPTVESIAEMKHLLCWAYDNLNDMPVSDEWAAGWCKEFDETEFGKTLMYNEPTASSAAGELPELPRLPDELLSRIGSYGAAARSECGSEADRLFRWEQLISGIKNYAADYARAALLRRAARVEVTDAMVERLAKFIVSKESINCKTLYEAMFHQSNWRRAVSESREMLTAALGPRG